MTATAPSSSSTSGIRATADRCPTPIASAEGANPLCGDRIRIQLRVGAGDTIADARFTADACALCIASASLLTDGVRGMATRRGGGARRAVALRLLGGEPPRARRKCATLPLDTLRRAAANLPSAAQ